MLTMTPGPVAQSNQVGTISVVMIEDHALSRIGIRAFLAKYPQVQVVAEAESAEEGLAMVQAHQPDLVLMDVELPGINGMQAMEAIRAFCPKVRFVVLTAHDSEATVLEALRAGANGYCLKDIDSRRLLEAVETAVQGGLWLDPRIASLAIQSCLRVKDQMPEGESPVQSTVIASKDTPQGKVHLTERERDVLTLLVEGKSNTEIAKALVVSVHTAKAHVCSILQKLYVTDRVQAAVKAIREGLV